MLQGVDPAAAADQNVTASVIMFPEELNRYTLSDADREYLANNFRYHAPHGDQVIRYGVIRDAFGALAQLVMRQVPPSRERSVALTNLETANYWANAGIARNEKPNLVPEAE